MENGRTVNNNDSEVFLNGGADKGKVVQTLQQIINEVKGILEHNLMLIQEIEQNQEAREADGFSHNVALVCELLGSIAHVVELYNDLSSRFSLSLAKGSPADVDTSKEG